MSSHEVAALPLDFWALIDSPDQHVKLQGRHLLRPTKERLLTLRSDETFTRRGLRPLLTTIKTSRQKNRNMIQFVTQTVEAHLRGNPYPSLLGGRGRRLPHSEQAT